MVEKRFLDVFPEVKVKEETKNLFSKVTVSRVTVTSNRDFLRIFIISDTWIPGAVF